MLTTPERWDARHPARLLGSKLILHVERRGRPIVWPSVPSFRLATSTVLLQVFGGSGAFAEVQSPSMLCGCFWPTPGRRLRPSSYYSMMCCSSSDCGSLAVGSVGTQASGTQWRRSCTLASSGFPGLLRCLGGAELCSHHRLWCDGSLCGSFRGQ